MQQAYQRGRAEAVASFEKQRSHLQQKYAISRFPLNEIFFTNPKLFFSISRAPMEKNQ